MSYVWLIIIQLCITLHIEGKNTSLFIFLVINIISFVDVKNFIRTYLA